MPRDSQCKFSSRTLGGVALLIAVLGVSATANAQSISGSSGMALRVDSHTGFNHSHIDGLNPGEPPGGGFSLPPFADGGLVVLPPPETTAPIPEPATAALLALGGVALLRRRR